tara:strand:- start:361 stop:648 length:288 start_codon:yes stop_codon:yes gene_type:complete
MSGPDRGLRISQNRRVAFRDGQVWGLVLVPVEPLHFLIGQIGVGVDCINRALGHTGRAVDALIRVDDEILIGFVEALYWADCDAVLVLAILHTRW